jgi:predicted deacetylase
MVNSLKRHWQNSKGMKTPEKLIVFQSDDWGSFRTHSAQALRALEKRGVTVKKCHYMQHDTMASDQDLVALFETIKSVKDFKGNHPVLTANVLMSNPDFDQIQSSHYESYASLNLSESFQKMKERDPRYAQGLKLWHEGMQEGIFKPQLHGCEHVHVKRWLRGLKEGNELLLEAFKWEMWGISRHTTSALNQSLQAAFELDIPGDEEFMISRLEYAIDAFKETFGNPSVSFTPPNYTWFNRIENVLSEHGVKFLQTFNVQRIPSSQGITNKRLVHGTTSERALTYMVRNVHFEPSENPSIDYVSRSMKEISSAFFWKRPAIISSHRVNYIGAINEKNRKRGLTDLQDLLQRIVKTWPDVQFISSEQLAHRMK